MMRGRPKTPTVLKLLAGTDRPDRRNTSEPKPEPLALDARPPRRLSRGAKRLWSEILSSCPLGLITVSDVSTLSRYVELLHDYQRLREDVELRGRTEERFTATGLSKGHFTRAAVVQMNQLLPELRNLESLLGLNPAGRGRCRTVQTASFGDSLDEELFG